MEEEAYHEEEGWEEGWEEEEGYEEGGYVGEEEEGVVGHSGGEEEEEEGIPVKLTDEEEIAKLEAEGWVNTSKVSNWRVVSERDFFFFFLRFLSFCVFR